MKNNLNNKAYTLNKYLIRNKFKIRNIQNKLKKTYYWKVQKKAQKNTREKIFRNHIIKK